MIGNIEGISFAGGVFMGYVRGYGRERGLPRSGQEANGRTGLAGEPVIGDVRCF